MRKKPQIDFINLNEEKTYKSMYYKDHSIEPSQYRDLYCNETNLNVIFTSQVDNPKIFGNATTNWEMNCDVFSNNLNLNDGNISTIVVQYNFQDLTYVNTTLNISAGERNTTKGIELLTNHPGSNHTLVINKTVDNI